MTNWLKILHTFPRNPKIRRLASALKCPKLLAQGLAMQWLIFIDEQTTNGDTGLTSAELDAELGHPGATLGLVSIGWAIEDAEGFIHAVDFEKHCGETAKKRAEESRRKAKQRQKCPEKSGTNVPQKKEKCPTPSPAPCPVFVPEKAGAEKEKEEEKEFIVSIETSGVTEPCNMDTRPPSPPPAPSLAEVQNVMQGLMLQPLRPAAMLSECASRFLDSMESSGWMDSHNVPIRQWKAAARLWAKRYAENLTRKPRTQSANPQPRKDCNDPSRYL